MAKKTPQFNSAKARDKWSQLQSVAGTSIDRLVQGQATTTDVQKVSVALRGLSTVASTVFDEAIDAAQKTALQVQEAGKIDIKAGLTSFELALNSALQVSFKDTVEQIKDILELDLLEQTEELNKTLGSKFEDLKLILPPKDLPTVNDLLSNNELIFEGLEKSDDDKWEQRADTLLDRIYNMFNETLRNVKMNVPVPVQSKRGIVKGQRHVMNPYELRTVADRGQALLGNPAQDVADIIDADTQPIGGATSIKPDAEDVVDSLDSNTDLLKRIERMLDARDNGARPSSFKDADVEDEKKEKEKADTWWRSFKGWMGDSWKDKKKKGKDWLKTLFKDLAGVGLLSMLLSPQLWTTLADNIEKYVTWDNIKGAAISTWEWMKDKTDTVVDWLLDKLGIGKPKSQTNLTPNASSALQNVPMTERLAGMGPSIMGAAISKMTPEEREKAFKEVPSAKANYENFLKEQKHATASVTDVAQEKLGNFTSWVGDTVTSISNSMTGGGQRSTLSPKVSPGGGPPTRTSINSSINVAPGITSTLSGPSGMMTGNPGSIPRATGSPQVGIKTFGFHSGVDDSLLLMNSSFLGH